MSENSSFLNDPIDSDGYGDQSTNQSNNQSNNQSFNQSINQSINQFQSSHEKSRHKTACFFHCFFRGSALAWYFINQLILENFIAGFVICVLLLAFDFWTVKNVTGRLLVGLRWWNEVKDDGTNVWIFESKPDQREVNQSDSFLFWSTLYVTPLIWGIIGLANIVTIQLRSLLIVIVAVTLSTANVVGYWRCQRDATSSARSRISNFILSRI